MEISNLQRQILHTVSDLGRPKVESARDRLRLLNPETEVEAHFLRVEADNAAAVTSSSLTKSFMFMYRFDPQAVLATCLSLAHMRNRLANSQRGISYQ